MAKGAILKEKSIMNRTEVNGDSLWVPEKL
jgi:hypothetical protein